LSEGRGGDRPGRPPARVLRDPWVLAALGGGAGLSPWAPGTAGTVVGVAVYAAALTAGSIGYVLVTIAAAIGGVTICRRAAPQLGGVHDHPAIVWDEIAGYLVTMLPVALGFVAGGWRSAVAGFALFRLFDIAKPWPVGSLDRRLMGGIGMMADDLAAGAMAAVALAALGPTELLG